MPSEYERIAKNSGIEVPKRLDPMFTKVGHKKRVITDPVKSEVAKKRAADELKDDPDKYKKLGRAGGLVKGIKKGLAALPKDRLKEIRSQAQAARDEKRR
jgi:hypothetical protein